MWRKIAEITVILIGIFLALDGFIWHGLTFDYSVIGLSWLDPYISHGFIGLVLIGIGVLDYEMENK